MSKASLYLPWPDKRLSPNARVHWTALARAKKDAKKWAYHCALEAGLRNIDATKVSVRYTFSPPTLRRRDQDNLIASMKAAADGIAMAIGIDDSQWQIAVSPCGPVEKNGMVKVDIEWEQTA